MMMFKKTVLLLTISMVFSSEVFAADQQGRFVGELTALVVPLRSCLRPSGPGGDQSKPGVKRVWFSTVPPVAYDLPEVAEATVDTLPLPRSPKPFSVPRLLPSDSPEQSILNAFGVARMRVNNWLNIAVGYYQKVLAQDVLQSEDAINQLKAIIARFDIYDDQGFNVLGLKQDERQAFFSCCEMDKSVDDQDKLVHFRAVPFFAIQKQVERVISGLFSTQDPADRKQKIQAMLADENYKDSLKDSLTNIHAARSLLRVMGFYAGETKISCGLPPFEPDKFIEDCYKPFSPEKDREINPCVVVRDRIITGSPKAALYARAANFFDHFKGGDKKAIKDLEPLFNHATKAYSSAIAKPAIASALGVDEENSELERFFGSITAPKEDAGFTRGQKVFVGVAAGTVVATALVAVGGGIYKLLHAKYKQWRKTHRRGNFWQFIKIAKAKRRTNKVLQQRSAHRPK